MIQNEYEGTRFLEKLKEFSVLLVFIAIAAIVSLITMNVLAFPLSLFAVKMPAVFTQMVKIFILIVILSYICFRIIRRIRTSRADGISVFRAFGSSFIRKSKTFLLSMCILVFLLLLCAFLYLFMKYNYIILYELSL